MLSPGVVTNATSLVLAALSVYYLTASVFLARSSVPDLKMMPLTFSTAMSAVPAGLVRKRGMLFFAEACMVLLVPSVEHKYLKSMLLAWSLRSIAGAVRAFQGDGMTPGAEHDHVSHWRPEALALVAVGLCCGASAFDSSTTLPARCKDSTDKVHRAMHAQPAGSDAPRRTPLAMHVTFMVSAALSMLGIGMLLSPSLFIDDLVCKECVWSRAGRAAELSQLPPVPVATMEMFLDSQLQLSRDITASLGVQLLYEAANLLLLPLALRDPVLQWTLCVICSLRAFLATLVAALNYALGGLMPTAHADTALCFLFAVVYTVQAVVHYPAKDLEKKSE